MSVLIYEGKPGAGKSYHAVVREVLPAVRAGRRVYHNIDGLDVRRFADMTGKSVEEVRFHHIETPDEWLELLVHQVEDKEGLNLKLEKKSLVVIDEAQMIWNSRDFKNTKKGFMDLLAYHRHFGLDFVFITQDAKSLETYVSRLCEACYTIKNLGFISRVLKNQYVIHVKQRPRDPIVSTMRGSYDPKYFGLYRSAVEFNPYERKTKSAVSSAGAFLVVSFVAYLALHFWSHGWFSTPKGLKDDLRARGNLNLGSQKNLGLGGTSNPPSGPVAPAVSTSTETVHDGRLTAAQALASGNDPKKLCYPIARQGHWSITYKGRKETGDSNWQQIMCF